jgi:hypothetical protein
MAAAASANEWLGRNAIPVQDRAGDRRNGIWMRHLSHDEPDFPVPGGLQVQFGSTQSAIWKMFWRQGQESNPSRWLCRPFFINGFKNLHVNLRFVPTGLFRRS